MIDNPIQDALRQIDAMESEIIQTLCELVRIPSMNPKYPGLGYDEHVGGETRCNQALSATFEAAGCEIDMWAEEPGRDNLVGTIRGAGGGRSLIMNGHVDTVPPEIRQRGLGAIPGVDGSKEEGSTVSVRSI